ncbi:myosin [Gregarina niphandrodes]|uniref:Myosin n=1 Tax=Gregarina niphandrodes TaxID=110365 RepID=A0A023B832_GRENI|nr:myosin [Gregarina niphandrodes]EZG68218.1 myosin [Gregarina niphandrodes]|eukprot:XP_011130020.1 myosin [Gregarina niphandrodes]
MRGQLPLSNDEICGLLQEGYVSKRSYGLRIGPIVIALNPNPLGLPGVPILESCEGPSAIDIANDAVTMLKSPCTFCFPADDYDTGEPLTHESVADELVADEPITDETTVPRLPVPRLSVPRLPAKEGPVRMGRRVSILLCGESGSGKTENCKRIIRHFVKDPESAMMTDLLESIGNARTSNNRNSSRFVTLSSLKFRGGYKLKLNIHAFLLAKGRITKLVGDELNFPVLYMAVHKAPDYGLSANVEDYHILTSSHSDGNHDDGSLVAATDEAMTGVISYVSRITSVEHSLKSLDIDIEKFWRCLLIVLLLGNGLEMFAEKGTSEKGTSEMGTSEKGTLEKGTLEMGTSEMRTSYSPAESVAMAGKLLRIESAGRWKELLESVKVFDDTRRQYSKREERLVLEGLIKELYESLFRNCINKINAALNRITYHTHCDLYNCSIDVLDIYGFETLVGDEGGIDQLLINYVNEMIHAQFTETFRIKRIELLREEGIILQQRPTSDATDNLSLEIRTRVLKCRQALMALNDSINTKFDVGKDRKYTDLCMQLFEYKKRDLNRELGFEINHYAKPVYYLTNGIVDTACVYLKPELAECLQNSSISTVIETQKPQVASHKSQATSFITAIDRLFSTMQQFPMLFIRHIKPCDQGFTGQYQFDLQKVKNELINSGIKDILYLMQNVADDVLDIKVIADHYRSEIPMLNKPIRLSNRGENWGDGDRFEDGRYHDVAPHDVAPHDVAPHMISDRHLVETIFSLLKVDEYALGFSKAFISSNLKKKIASVDPPRYCDILRYYRSRIYPRAVLKVFFASVFCFRLQILRSKARRAAVFLQNYLHFRYHYHRKHKAAIVIQTALRHWYHRVQERAAKQKQGWSAERNAYTGRLTSIVDHMAALPRAPESPTNLEEATRTSSHIPSQPRGRLKNVPRSRKKNPPDLVQKISYVLTTVQNQSLCGKKPKRKLNTMPSKWPYVREDGYYHC